MWGSIIAAVIAALISLLVLINTRLEGNETRKELDRTLDEQRTQTFNERFATAAELLGGDKPSEVRLAGVYAMAVLADSWEENRQTCADVLCGFLCVPYAPEPKPRADQEASDFEVEQRAFQGNREVRHTVIRLIAEHLRKNKKDDPASWQDLNFNFTGVVFDGGDFSGAEFSGGTVSFRRAVFPGGTVSFRRAVFSAPRGRLQRRRVLRWHGRLQRRQVQRRQVV